MEAQLRAVLIGCDAETGSHPPSFLGTLALDDAGATIDRFQIRIQLAASHPVDPPKVFEIGGRIERSPDRHISPDGSACLFVEDETKAYWGPNKTIADFINGPVRSFFIGQSYFEMTGEWIFGERKHGIEGVLQFYAEQFDSEDFTTIAELLRISGEIELNVAKICPCGSELKLKKCHLPQVQKVRTTVSRVRLKKLSQEARAIRSSSAKPPTKAD